jgi:hypothetical protein
MPSAPVLGLVSIRDLVHSVDKLSQELESVVSFFTADEHRGLRATTP